MVANSKSLSDAVIIFQLADKKCACSVDFIKEVARASSIYKIPNNHPLVEGILNLRGMIIPVIRFSSLLNLQETKKNTSHLVLVVNVSGFGVGLLVDHVFKVERVLKTNFDPSNAEDQNNTEKQDSNLEQDSKEYDTSWIPRRFLKEVVRLESGFMCPLLDSRNLSQALWAYVPDKERGQ